MVQREEPVLTAWTRFTGKGDNSDVPHFRQEETPRHSPRGFLVFPERLYFLYAIDYTSHLKGSSGSTSLE